MLKSLENRGWREFFMSGAGIVAATLAPKLGVPQEALTEFFVSVAAIVSSFALSRGIAKRGKA